MANLILLLFSLMVGFVILNLIVGFLEKHQPPPLEFTSDMNEEEVR